MDRVKKILTLEDLENFYSKYKRSTTFSSKKSGYQLAVQIPATFEVDNEYKDDTLLFCKSRMFHIGLNRNKSNVTKEAAEKAMKTMAYKPLLANFAEFEDENGNTFTDFTSHDMVIENDEIKYLEHQIGCITADEPWFEDYEGKTYVCGYLAIPRDYSEAVDVIEAKQGTKVSVELLINELIYDAKSKELVLTDVVVSGLTCLGRNPETGEEVQEGMINSRLDIKDFSKENNSIIDFSDMTDKEHSKLIETLEKLNTTLKTISNFNIDETKNFSNNEKKGGDETLTKLEELLAKYNKTVEELDFEIDGLSDEELESKFAEVFEDDGSDGSDSDVNGAESNDASDGEVTTGSEDGEQGTENSETEEEQEQQEEEEEEKEEYISDNVEGRKEFSKTFELSHDDIRSALYALLESYEEADNDWYWICAVYDSYFVYQGIRGNYWGQKYTKDNDTVAFDGERYELFAEFVTTSEKTELEKMRANYSFIEAELNKYKEAELNAQREAVFNDEVYSEFVETDSFKKIKENINTYSVEDLRTACDLAFAKEVKNKGTFAFNGEKKDEKKAPSFFAFAAQEKDTSFLDSLLHMKK